MNEKTSITNGTSNGWQIRNPLLRAAAYAAPFAWFGTLIMAMTTQGGIKLLNILFYGAGTILSAGVAFDIRSTASGIEGWLKKTVFLVSIAFVTFYALAVVIGLLIGVAELNTGT